MDIKEMLTSGIEDLLDEELEMLEEELTIGDYSKTYRLKCQNLIVKEQRRRYALKVKASRIIDPDDELKISSEINPALLVPPDQLSPFNKVEVKPKSPFSIVSSDVAAIRRAEKRKSLFRDYVDQQELLDEKLLDEHLSFFDKWELGVILEKKKLSEPFLEKYLPSLDADKLARTQVFSEEFFMRHFGELDAALVLQKGKNDWRKKENRSKKLDTFLRLKGVKL